MPNVKLVVRTLNVFEIYAARRKPLTLTELSQGLEAPISSTLALVRTLVKRGYLYQTRRRMYYPTKKLTQLCAQINACDPILDVLRPFLTQLRDESSETAVLGTCEGDKVVYLDVVHSRQAIRYNASAGETRSLYANSLGKALLSAFSETKLQETVSSLSLDAITDSTHTTQASLLKDISASKQRGWASNVAESVPDLAAIAMPFMLGEKWYAMSIVGPITRIQAKWDEHIRSLTRVVTAIKKKQEDGTL